MTSITWCKAFIVVRIQYAAVKPSMAKATTAGHDGTCGEKNATKE
jgi:hypothetical protein